MGSVHRRSAAVWQRNRTRLRRSHPDRPGGGIRLPLRPLAQALRRGSSSCSPGLPSRLERTKAAALIICGISPDGRSQRARRAGLFLADPVKHLSPRGGLPHHSLMRRPRAEPQSLGSCTRDPQRPKKYFVGGRTATGFLELLPWLLLP